MSPIQPMSRPSCTAGAAGAAAMLLEGYIFNMYLEKRISAATFCEYAEHATHEPEQFEKLIQAYKAYDRGSITKNWTERAAKRGEIDYILTKLREAAKRRLWKAERAARKQ